MNLEFIELVEEKVGQPALLVVGGGNYFQQSDLLLRLNPAPTRDTIVAEVNADVEAGFGSPEDCGGKRNADNELGAGFHGVMLQDGGV